MAETNRTLTSPGVERWIGDVERFFDVPLREQRYDALYVWWPDSVQVVTNPRGRFLVLRALVGPGEQLNVSDVVAHEVVHVIAARQTSAQKRSISDAFLRDCPVIPSAGRLSVIEEPLAVVFGTCCSRERSDASAIDLRNVGTATSGWISMPSSCSRRPSTDSSTVDGSPAP